MSQDIYKNGLPFNGPLDKNLNDQTLRVEGRKASLIIIDGGVGEGKTTMAVHVADNLQGQEIKLTPKLENCEQVAMGGKDFLKKMRICFQKKHKVIVYDEAGDFNKRGSLTRFNAMLNRTFETYRAFKIVVVLVLPNFNVLDNDLFDKKIPRMLLDCYDRPLGGTYGNYRAYSLYRMMYVKEKMKKLTVKPQAYGMTTPNFYGHFKDISPERSRALDNMSTSGKIKELQSSEIQIEGLVSYQDIADRLACSISKVQMYVKELKLRPVRYFQRKAYYQRDVIDILADHIDERVAIAYEEKKKHAIQQGHHGHKGGRPRKKRRRET